MPDSRLAGLKQRRRLAIERTRSLLALVRSTGTAISSLVTCPNPIPAAFEVDIHRLLSDYWAARKVATCITQRDEVAGAVAL